MNFLISDCEEELLRWLNRWEGTGDGNLILKSRSSFRIRELTSSSKQFIAHCTLSTRELSANGRSICEEHSSGLLCINQNSRDAITRRWMVRPLTSMNIFFDDYCNCYVGSLGQIIEFRRKKGKRRKINYK